jgi:hypothetical protein
LILKIPDVVPALLLSPDSSRDVVPELLRQQQQRVGVAAEKSVITATSSLSCCSSPAPGHAVADLFRIEPIADDRM